jgi:hypothetical protein
MAEPKRPRECLHARVGSISRDRIVGLAGGQGAASASPTELVGRGVEFDVVELGDFKMVDHLLTTPVGSSA